MKINGSRLSEPYIETIVIPRNPDPIILKAKAILDYATFEKMVPFPEPPVRIYAGSTDKHPNLEDAGYKKAVARRGLLRHYWMCIQSLLATPGLEFEHVKVEEPETWDQFEDELAKAGFTPFDIGRIINGIMTANGLNDAKIKQAEKDFLSKRPAAPDQHRLPSLVAAVRSMQSGKPANVSP